MIINAGIGDSDMLITKEQAGVLVQDFSADSYRGAIDALGPFAANPDETRGHVRAVAERLFYVHRVGGERYARLYEEVLNGPTI